jgi:hypothetical protein
MPTKNKKLKLHIKARHQKLWTNIVLTAKLRALGLHVATVTHAKGHSELEIHGDEANLWKAISLAKKPLFFVELDQVSFEFSD